jgi:precorrin-3B synthase
MTAAIEQRRGSCPSLWNPMRSGDGLIVRVQSSVRGLRSVELRALATLADRHGNGLLEATRRSNLQLRGIKPESVSQLQAELVEAGIAAPVPVLPLWVDPYADLLKACVPLEALVREIASLPLPSGLPSKFGVVLHAGGPSRVAADIRLDVDPAQPEVVQLSAANDGAGNALALGVYPAAEAGRLILQLMAAMVARLAANPAAGGRATSTAGRAILSDGGQTTSTAGRATLSDGGAQSMPSTTARAELWRLLAADGGQSLRAELSAHAEANACGRERPVEPPAASFFPIGFHTDARSWFGLGIPFGSAPAQAWQQLAELAERHGDGTLRFTPERAVLLPGVRARAVPQLRAAGLAAGFCVEPGDPLLRTIACSGAPRCDAAFGETRQLARELAPRLHGGARLHVSGCSKGCAERGPSTFTLVLAADGCRLGLAMDPGTTAHQGRVLSLAQVRAQLPSQPSAASNSTPPRAEAAIES